MSEPSRTRLEALEGIKAAVAADVIDQVGCMVELGWNREEAYVAVCKWWHDNIGEAMEVAIEQLGLKP